ncbi:hypothetical protein DL93DRAFT_2091640 [Clavulina sp. PMI_390]|nr:hypothetical protein DL93DRAFT_2091640 [Clavulina sp. PMI_390]
MLRQINQRLSLSNLAVGKWVILPYSHPEIEHYAVLLFQVPEPGSSYEIFFFDSLEDSNFVSQDALAVLLGQLEVLLETNNNDLGTILHPPEGDEASPNTLTSQGTPSASKKKAAKPPTLAKFRKTTKCVPRTRMKVVRVPTGFQENGHSCGMWTIEYVRRILGHWPPCVEELRSGPSWLVMSDAEVEADRCRLMPRVIDAMSPGTPWKPFNPEMPHSSAGSQLAREEYMSMYIKRHVGLDPSAVVEVQALDPLHYDVAPVLSGSLTRGKKQANAQNSEDDPIPARFDMKISTLLSEVMSPIGRRLTALSMPTPNLLPSLQTLERLISDTRHAMDSAQLSSHSSASSNSQAYPFFGHELAMDPTGFTIISGHGSTHAQHIDNDGWHTALSMLEGWKAFLLAIPKDLFVGLPRHLDGVSPTILFEDEDVVVVLVVIGPGDTL